jgi:hypothetical protein
MSGESCGLPSKTWPVGAFTLPEALVFIGFLSLSELCGQLLGLWIGGIAWTPVQLMDNPQCAAELRRLNLFCVGVHDVLQPTAQHTADYSGESRAPLNAQHIQLVSDGWRHKDVYSLALITAG